MTVKIATTRFGELEVPEEEIVEFPEGLPGFQGRRYVQIKTTGNELVTWIQSIEEPHVALLTVDPTELVKDYRNALKLVEAQPLKLEAADQLDVRAIVRDAPEEGAYLLNLFAPILLNSSKRLGMQLPLVGSGYSLRQPWPPQQREATSAPQAQTGPAQAQSAAETPARETSAKEAPAGEPPVMERLREEAPAPETSDSETSAAPA
ncbi:MAG: flagellar assembly protein FliW [Deltaproteobacteria bacterium]|nr:flagellar assembly protein FliW [Deltaproteobacteria bacterium]